MNGGIVIEVIHLDDKTWVNCQGEGDEKNLMCGIYVQRSFDINVKDKVIWEGIWAYWNSATGALAQQKLRRLSEPGAARPEIPKSRPRR